ncbi:ABC transporter permease subunit [Halosegnis rubeus]|uniref:ABC transporter permease subunit n=1 Tax=Halosegnis rubeus TaxID=2212850 RepID=A0A5N5U4U8_9EURY|nr:ABC transporter permease [Halosegnis rubeus]KAB7512844.1 ABC transporter permease subunit [Halosegnis rubeus]KAB7512961.1 ABC transporter permease subunit [Halosegnis rubeus]KAB7513709.1 ABC transporter permease subunit [Halosegnis rubeus]
MSTQTDTSSNALRAETFEGNLQRYLRGLGGLVVFLLVWWVGAMTTQPSYLVPGPLESVYAFIELFATSTTIVAPVLGSSLVLPTGLAHLAQTLFHYVPGLLLGAGCGIGLGLAMGWNGVLDDWLRPLVRVLRPIPPLAWIVFAIVWFGIHHTGAAFIVFVGAFWINFYGAYGGVEGVSTDLTDAASTLGVERDLSMLKLVALPSAAPQVLTGFRTSIGRCWMIVVGAELFGAPGVGYEIINASNNLAMATSVAYMFLISLAFLCMDVGFRLLERRVLAWR